MQNMFLIYSINTYTFFLWRSTNGVPQGSVSFPPIPNIYIYISDINNETHQNHAIDATRIV